MTYVLDTSALSALMRANASSVARLRQEKKNDVLLPQPVVAEIEYGIARLRASRKKKLLQQRFAAFRHELIRVPWTDEVSEHFGRVKAQLERRGERLDDFDIAIAAHALAAEAILVTTNLRHLRRVPGLSAEDWTE